MNTRRNLAARMPRLRTFLSFGAIQAAQMVLPLLALPYLSRVLGPGPFGATLYMLAVSAVAGMCVEWGFALGAVRDVATHRDDPVALGRTVADVLSAKCLLTSACAVLGVAGWALLPLARQHPWGFALAVANGVALGFNPLWFFQGLGAGVARVAACEVGGGLAVLCLMLPLVREPEHWTRYLLLLLLIRVGMYAWLTGRVFSCLGPRAASMRPSGGWRALRDARHLFLAHLGAMAKTHGVPLLLGGVLPARDMGMLIVCDKMARGLVSLTMPVILTLFPELCAARRQGRGDDVLRRVLMATGLAMGGGAVAVWGLAPWLVTVALGPEYAQAAPLLRWLCPLLVLLPLNCVLGTLGLVPQGRERALTLAIGASSLAGLSAALPLAATFGVVAGTWLAAGMEGLILVVLLIALRRTSPHAACPDRRHP